MSYRPWSARLIPAAYREAVLGDAWEELGGREEVAPWRFRVRLHAYLLFAAFACWRQVLTNRTSPPAADRKDRLVMRGLLMDVRYAVRTLLRTPGFVMVSVITLAVGIAGVTSMYNLLYGAMIRPLAYDRADELVVLHTNRQDEAFPALSIPDLADVRTASRELVEIATWRPWQVTVPLADGTPTRTIGASVDSRYFSMLGVVPAVGRAFTPADDRVGHEPVVVVSHAYWQTALGADPAIAGKSAELDGVRYTIVGVAPAGFTDPLAASFALATPPFWRASPDEFANTNRSWRSFWGLARRAPGATLEQVAAELGATARTLRDEWPATNAEVAFSAVPLREHLVGANRPTIVMLTAAVFLVLIIACANVANLLLARGTTRSQEHAVRRALGAGRSRVARPLVVEHGLLAIAGVLTGLAGAAAVSRLVRPWTQDLATLVNLRMDLPVIVGAAFIGLFVTILFGLVPAWQAVGASSEPGSGSGLGSRAVGAPGALLRRALVVSQTTLAVVILIAAGLLLQGLRRVQAVDLGVATDRSLVAEITPSATRYATPAALDAVVSEIVANAARIRGVAAVGLVSDLPLSGQANSGWVTRPDRPVPAGSAPPSALYRTVAGDYFEAAGIAMHSGRRFDDGDHAGSPPVAVLNRAAVDLLFPDDEPLGKSVQVMGQTREVVGVVNNVREQGPTVAAPPAVYVPFTQEAQEWATRTTTIMATVATGGPIDYAAPLRAAVLEVDPSTAVNDIRAMRDVAALVTRPLRVRTTLLGMFAGVAMALATVGLGAIVAFQVARRRRELSLRMALGVTPGGVVKLLVGQAMRLSGVGIVGGVVLAIAVGRVFGHLLSDVRLADPVVFLTVPAVFLGAAGVAGVIPAWRAARLAPAEALKQE